MISSRFLRVLNLRLGVRGQESWQVRRLHARAPDCHAEQRECKRRGQFYAHVELRWRQERLLPGGVTSRT